MYAAHFITDAAVFPPRPPRDPFGLVPSVNREQHGRRSGLIALLLGRRSSRARHR